MSEPLLELNFDGIVGPTHNFAGLSHGNVASAENEGSVSSPRSAALEGLGKMRALAKLGVPQAVLPPQLRPSVSTLRALGFSGSDEEILGRVGRDEPHLLRLVSSASAMWAANAATVAPSRDARDGRVHLVPANLCTMFHRAIEAATTRDVLRAIFRDEKRFVVHEPLPATSHWSDEGAANHTRLETSRGAAHVFAWGRRAFGAAAGEPSRYPARQTFEASHALARALEVAPDRAFFPQQHAGGIDRGAFHTDVVAVGHRSLLLVHELAFTDAGALVDALRRVLGDELRVERATETELPIADAVAAYPFNSQIVTVRGSGDAASFVIIAPVESRENERAHAFLEGLVARGAVSRIEYLDVRQSMRNGGGPACLRLRVALTSSEIEALRARVVFDDALDRELVGWVERRYRDRLVPRDLADPALHRESLEALDELTRILRLGSVYDFQR